MAVGSPSSNHTPDSATPPTRASDPGSAEDIDDSIDPPRHRWRSSAARFALIALAADALIIATAVVLVGRFRTEHFVTPYGAPGDLAGHALIIGAALLSNWVWGLYRLPPPGTALSWVGRVGMAVLTAVGLAAIASAALNRPVATRASVVLLVLIVPGALVGVRQVVQLFVGFNPRPDERVGLAASAEIGRPWFADIGWAAGRRSDDANTSNLSDDGAATDAFVVKVRPSELVIHRLDQFAVITVTAWAVPVVAVTAIAQRLRRRPVRHRPAPNGVLVPTFDLRTGSIAQRLGIDRLPALWNVWCGRVSLLDPTASDSSLATTRRVRRWPFVLSWLITFRVFGLGHATGDTWGHILQATGEWTWNAWHPLLNAMIFVPSYRLFGSPILVTGTVIGSFWLALWLATRSVERATGRNLTVVAVLFGFNPMLFNFMGLLAKDAFAAAGIVICVSLLMRERVREPGMRWSLLLAGLAAWTAALFNPAVITIVIALLSYVSARALATTSWRAGFRLVAAGALGVILALSTVAAEGVWEAALDVPPSRKEQAIMLFDIAGMSDDLGENLLPEGFIPPNRVDEFLTDCYDPKEWDSLTTFGAGCTWVLEGDEAIRVWDAGELSTVWKQSIEDHPGTYVRTRLRHIEAFLTSPGKAPTYYWWEIGDFNGNWQLDHNRVQDEYSGFYGATADSILFRPITWLTGSVVLLAAFAIRRRRGAPSSWGALPFVTCAAVVMFYAGWTLIGVAYDFRYNYSAIWLFFLTLFMLISDTILSRPARRSYDPPTPGVHSLTSSSFSTDSNASPSPIGSPAAGV